MTNRDLIRLRASLADANRCAINARRREGAGAHAEQARAAAERDAARRAEAWRAEVAAGPYRTPQN